ncbi:MAG: hypothetical protein QHI38_11605 [Armatimonadota bacterium]|nr:hypothetical protein [Armatimonadota bacterium]
MIRQLLALAAVSIFLWTTQAPCLADSAPSAVEASAVQNTQSAEDKANNEQEKARRETERREEADHPKSKNTNAADYTKTQTAPKVDNSALSEGKRSKHTDTSVPLPNSIRTTKPSEEFAPTGDQSRREKIRLEVEKRRLVELEELWRSRWWRYRPITWSDCYLSGRRTLDLVPLLTAVVSSASGAADNPDTVQVASLPTASSESNTTETRVAQYVRETSALSHRYELYGERTAQRSHLALVVAPGNTERRTSVGLQYISNKGYGLGLWFSGSFGPDTDIIDATIPHEDYYTVTRWRSYSVQGLVGIGSESATFIFGGGLSVEETTYIDVSNVTGWKWYGGETREIKPCAIAGCRLSLGDRISLQLGYDTSRHAFFGFAAAF